jgi:hypothetical protein
MAESGDGGSKRHLTDDPGAISTDQKCNETDQCNDHEQAFARIERCRKAIEGLDEWPDDPDIPSLEQRDRENAADALRIARWHTREGRFFTLSALSKKLIRTGVVSGGRVVLPCEGIGPKLCRSVKQARWVESLCVHVRRLVDDDLTFQATDKQILDLMADQFQDSLSTPRIEELKLCLYDRPDTGKPATRYGLIRRVVRGHRSGSDRDGAGVPSRYVVTGLLDILHPDKPKYPRLKKPTFLKWSRKESAWLLVDGPHAGESLASVIVSDLTYAFDLLAITNIKKNEKRIIEDVLASHWLSRPQ